MRLRLAAIAVLAVLAAVAAAAASAGTAAHRAGGEITVMTQNLFPGTELLDVRKARTASALQLAFAKDFGQLVATKFNDRAAALATEIAKEKPDLISLQDVALWRTAFPFKGPAQRATTVAYDFLATLNKALAAKGAHYRTVIVHQNFDANGAGLFKGKGVEAVRFTDSIAILASTDTPASTMTLSNPQQGSYKVVTRFTSPFGVTVLGGGWLSVDVKTGGGTFRLVSTLLDGFSPKVNGAQEAELLKGPTATSMPVLIAGDFNAPDTTPAYSAATSAGFVDLWKAANPNDPGYTCCEPDTLRNPTPQLHVRLDYLLGRGPFSVVAAHLVGASPSDKTPSGLWPSNHAGIVATLKVG
jgi:endonuclease/exonuclease/phosphatase (EEP) superfamily protein YafD